MNESTWVSKQIIKIKDAREWQAEEPVVIEKALTVYLNDEEFVTVVCSPGLEQELITGFLYSEGVIKVSADFDISLDLEKGLAWVQTKTETGIGQKLFLKRYLTSCCGKGRSSFYFANDARLAVRNEGNLRISASQVNLFSTRLEEQSELFRLTGGVHSGALATTEDFDFYAHDIGRHNVLDKLCGLALNRGVDLAQRVLVFSGRISSEILIKTAKMGCPILIGRSAPTDLALELADELGITVVGFARQDRMNIYTHPGRIVRS